MNRDEAPPLPIPEPDLSAGAAEVAAPIGAWRGIAMVVAGAILLGSKGVLAKLLYARGLDYQTVVSLRAVLAIPGFVLIAAWLGGVSSMRSLAARDVAAAIFAGVLCYYFGAGVNFYALTLIDASVERALLYSYPALVVVAVWILSRQRPKADLLVAVIVTYAGVMLTVGLPGEQTNSDNLVGGMWVMVCAATIAVYFLISARLTRTMGSAQFTLVAMTASALALALHYQLSHGWQHLTLDRTSWLWMAVLVVFATVLPLYFVAEGVRRIGAERAAVASTVGPPAAAVLAIALLGERLGLTQVVGIALIVSGILVLEIRKFR